MSAIWGTLELAFALIGCMAGRWVLTSRIAAEQNRFWIHILAGVIMAAVGLRMLLQAFQKKTLLEHRMETVDIKADTVLSLRLCIQAMLLGISCGLLRLPVHILLISVFGFSAIFAGIGYVSGRANGALFTDQATGIGGALLCVLGIVLQIA
jgi:putative Mn2+ efflux pump MntP